MRSSQVLVCSSLSSRRGANLASAGVSRAHCNLCVQSVPCITVIRLPVGQGSYPGTAGRVGDPKSPKLSHWFTSMRAVSAATQRVTYIPAPSYFNMRSAS